MSAGDGRRPPSDVLREDVHGRTIHMVVSCPLYSEGVQRVPFILYARCPPEVNLEVQGHLC